MRQHSGTLASNDLYVNLLQSFDIHLRARNRSERTNETYIDSTTQFLEFAIDRDLPSQPTQWTRSHVEGFMAFLMEERGLKSSTANNRYRGLQAFFRWLEDEGDIPYSPMGEYTNSKGLKVRRMQPPKIDTTAPEVLKADDLEKLLGTCLKGKTDVDRRDAAIISLFIDTGCRLAELSNLTVDDVDVTILVHVAHITGTQEAVCSHCLCRRVRALPVACGNIRPLDADLATLADRQLGFAAVERQDANLRARHRHTA
mgnify:CR=1 FL=1